MRSNMSNPMKTLLTAIVTAAFFASPADTEAFEIQRIGKDKQYASVDGDWIANTECIEVKFAAAADINPGLLFLRAYFFDAEGKQVLMYSKPSKIDLGTEVVSMPKTIEAGGKYTVYFAIPESIETRDNKWRRVVIVLGARGERSGVTAKVYPTDDLEKFDFPEKSKLK